MYQSFISEIVQSLIGLLILVVVALIVQMKQKIMQWIESRTSTNQRDLLHKIAQEAFSFAETSFRDFTSPQKLDAAYGYLSSRLRGYGISLTSEELRAAIEKAVLEYNAQTKSNKL